jgi:polyhydroxyalkanoate synthesis regulator phasin
MREAGTLVQENLDATRGRVDWLEKRVVTLEEYIARLEQRIKDVETCLCDDSSPS